MSENRHPIRLGFTRGTSPDKWAERWRNTTRSFLELIPMEVAFGRSDSAALEDETDIMLERARPGDRPEGSEEPRTRHAVRLYEESTALVVPTDHELGGQSRVTLEELQLVELLDHADHAAVWPSANPWADPSWKPADPLAALGLVASGVGSVLLPLPLARHLSHKREHSVIPVEDGLPGSTIWATWAVDRDGEEIQRLVGIMRGRTPRSSR